MPDTLLMDLGNTRLKWAFADSDGHLSQMQALAHSSEPNCWQPLWLDLSPRERPSKIVLSSVAGARGKELLQQLQKHFPQWPSAHLAHSPAEFQCSISGTQASTIWRTGYRKPECLGVDRFLAMLGALPLAPTLLVVVVGTAMTLDVVQDGLHRGGLIAPSPTLMQRSLNQATAQLPLAQNQSNTQGLADNTDSAIAQACSGAALALIEKTHMEWPNAQLVLAGGGAEALRRDLPAATLHIPDLILRGLWRYAYPDSATQISV